MCIDIEFVQKLLQFMDKKLELAMEAYNDTKQPAENITMHLLQFFYGAKLFEEHMKQVTDTNGLPDIDALNHSVISRR